jgi:DNA-binding NtrC family response regulator
MDVDKLLNLDKIILGKRILIVDDEKDVLDSLVELLANCKIDTASSYEQAAEMIDKNIYDLAILDIMGVNGYGLLEKTTEHNLPAIMLTAHGLSEENLLKSVREGAVYYAPKEELSNIKDIVAEVIDAVEHKKSTWERMIDRLAAFYDKKFNGPDWREKIKKYMEDHVDHSI